MLTCTGAGGSASSTATLTVNAPVPTVTISVSPTTITIGSSATLTWSSTNATSCTASGSWSGSQATSGTATETPAAVGTSTYTLSCTGAGGNGSNSASLTVNAPPAQAYVYTLNSNLNSNSTANISAFSESATDGSLTLLAGSPVDTGLPGGVSIAVDPQLNLLFAAGGSSSTGQIVAFAIDPATGNLSSKVTTTTKDIPTALAVGPSGQYLFMSSHNSDAIEVYSIAANGALTEISGSPYMIPGVGCGLFCEPTADELVYDSAAQTLYVDSHYGFVATFTVDKTTGALTFVYNEEPDGGTGLPGAITVNPAGTFVYPAGITNVGGTGFLGAFSVTTSATSGGNPEPLTPVTGQPFAVGNRPKSVVIEPTGKYLYVLDGGDNTVSAYQIDSTTGALTQLTSSPFAITDGTTSPSQMAVDASGLNLYVASTIFNGNQGGLTSYSIDLTTGNLTQTSSTPILPGTNANGPAQIAVYKIPVI
jgi:6-phosphogluconolactonase (cycloisomerase 2 family)